MTRFCGKVGFATTVETAPGVYKQQFVERLYYGDVNRSMRKFEAENKVNDNIGIANELSIVADPYAYENFHAIKYVWFMGQKWKATTIEVQYPRLKIQIGSLFTLN